MSFSRWRRRRPRRRPAGARPRGDGAQQIEVEARLGAVAVHRGQQDLAGAERCTPPGGDHSTASMPVAIAAAMGEDLPSAGRDWRLASMATTMHWLPNFSAPS
jgi:hypothetical protein